MVVSRGARGIETQAFTECLFSLCVDAFYWSLETKQREMVHGAQSWCKGGVPPSMRDPTFWLDAQKMLLGKRVE